MSCDVVSADCSGSANKELNAVNYVGLMCACSFKYASAAPVIHPISCHCDIAIDGKSHKWIVGRKCHTS